MSIGNADLIERRITRAIPIHPGGVLSSYVPFYFTPYSPMLLNIKTGYNGIAKRRNEEIVIIASSLHRLNELNVPFVFSDRHAYLKTAQFFSNLADLSKIDWQILQNRDFKRDENDLEKFDRYQAEALVYECCPVDAILGIGCFSEEVQESLIALVKERNLELDTIVRPKWYFS